MVKPLAEIKILCLAFNNCESYGVLFQCFVIVEKSHSRYMGVIPCKSICVLQRMLIEPR